MLKLINNKIKNKSGQSTLEYAILTVIVIGALMSIQIYVKRGVQGRLKSAGDDIGDQFSPNNTDIVSTVTTASTTRDTFQSGVTRSEMIERGETTSTVSTTNIIDTATEDWGN